MKSSRKKKREKIEKKIENVWGIITGKRFRKKEHDGFFNRKEERR